MLLSTSLLEPWGGRKRKHVQCEQRGSLYCTYVCHLLLCMSLLCGEKRKNLRSANPSTWSSARFFLSSVPAVLLCLRVYIVCFGSWFAQLKFLASYTPTSLPPHNPNPQSCPRCMLWLVGQEKHPPDAMYVLHKTSSWNYIRKYQVGLAHAHRSWIGFPASN